MTYIEGMAALQLVAEQKIGTPMRKANRAEDARMDASLSALRAGQ